MLMSSTCVGKAWHLFRPTFILISYTASTAITIITQLSVRFEVLSAMTVKNTSFFGCDTMQFGEDLPTFAGSEHLQIIGIIVPEYAV